MGASAAKRESGGDWLVELDPGPLEAFLSRTIPSFRAPLSLHPAKPDASTTFIVSTPDNRYVLRRAGESVDPETLEREFRVLAALHQRGFPVSQPLIYCDHDKLLGNAFYVTAHIEGRHYTDPAMPGASAAFRNKAYDSLNAVLAQLHMLDPRVIGVGSATNGRNYVSEQVDLCTKLYLAGATEAVPEMDQLIAWLPRNLPADRQPRVVHGDFRIENVLFHPTEPQVIGVLNWQYAGLGDPVADAVYHFITWILLSTANGGKGINEQDMAELGIPALDAYTAAYVHRTGLKTIPHFETYFAYSLFRMAVLEGMSQDRKALRTGLHLRPLAAMAWAFARRAGAT